MTDGRQLQDLISVGPATLADLRELGIAKIEQLIDKDAVELFNQLQQIKGQKLDRCCEDVFRAAIEQARDPNLPRKKCQWHYWSKVRKGQLPE